MLNRQQLLTFSFFFVPNENFGLRFELQNMRYRIGSKKTNRIGPK